MRSDNEKSGPIVAIVPGANEGRRASDDLVGADLAF
jgi:hypothetical protein